MSNFKDKTIHPETGEIQEAWFLDDYFGKHKYGIRFVGETRVFPIDQVTKLA